MGKEQEEPSVATLTPQRLASDINAAFGAAESILSMCSALLSRPLDSVASGLWRDAMLKQDENVRKRIRVIPDDALEAASADALFFVPSTAPAFSYPATGAPLPEGAAAMLRASYLAEHGVRMIKICATGVRVPMDQPLWSPICLPTVRAELYEALHTRFNDMAAAIVDGMAAKGAEGAVITAPRLAFTQDESSPFVGVIHLDCRCGFLPAKAG